MILVQGWVRLAAGEIDHLRPAASEMMRATRAEAGCLDYAFAADLDDPGMLRVLERWADEAALARISPARTCRASTRLWPARM